MVEIFCQTCSRQIQVLGPIKIKKKCILTLAMQKIIPTGNSHGPAVEIPAKSRLSIAIFNLVLLEKTIPKAWLPALPLACAAVMQQSGYKSL